jgi:hypothetical protein
MGARIQDDLKCLGKKRTQLSITFFPNAALDPVLSDPFLTRGVTSIVRVSQGLWRITLDSTWRRLISKQCSVQLAVAAAREIQFGAIANFNSASFPTIEVRAVDNAAAVQDIAADANNSISVDLVVGDSEAY